MNKHEKLRLTLLSGASDANIGFDDLCRMLEHFGFRMRVKSSHHVFTRPGLQERVTLQPEGRHAKDYQVRQVRKLLERHRIGETP